MQVPLTHSYPVAQAMQALPPVPHAALLLVSHVPPKQQPVGHVEALQTHW